MHEFGKKVITHLGTEHHKSPEDEHIPDHHEKLGEFEKKALEGKKHHSQESF